jgi:hypothetical protein
LEQKFVTYGRQWRKYAKESKEIVRAYRKTEMGMINPIGNDSG